MNGLIVLKRIKRLIFRFKYLPKRFWFNKDIGYNTYIDRRYTLITGDKYISIGNGTKILSGLRLEAISNYSGKTYRPSIIIGNDVCINQNLHCTCASKVEIGNGTSITANCGIFDIEHPYENIDENPRNTHINTKPVSIGKDCLIGMNTVILPGVHLGDHVIVGANSTVKEGTYPSNCVLVGSPAKIIKRFDSENNVWRRTDNNGLFLDNNSQNEDNKID